MSFKIHRGVESRKVPLGPRDPAVAIGNFAGQPTSARQASTYFVYVLRSLGDREWYIGQTGRHPELRLEEHNSGQVPSTKHRQPFELIYYEMYRSKKDVIGREKFLKGGSGHRFLKKHLKNFLQDSSRGGAAW